MQVEGHLAENVEGYFLLFCKTLCSKEECGKVFKSNSFCFDNAATYYCKSNVTNATFSNDD